MSYESVAVITNKEWEADVFVSVFAAASLRPPNLPTPTSVSFPNERARRSVPQSDPRLVLEGTNVVVTCWCLDDLIPPDRDSSDSAEKSKALKSFFRLGEGRNLRGVIGFGTAGWPTEALEAGAIVVGSGVLFVTERSLTSRLASFHRWRPSLSGACKALRGS